MRVWKYLDLAKFIWLLENNSLFLCRLNLLNDPHEGSSPLQIVELRKKELFEAEAIIAQGPQIWFNHNANFRHCAFVNCWRLGNDESEAMWRLYCPGNQGVAIQSTYDGLGNSIVGDPNLFMGCVQYIDYESDAFPHDNLLSPVMHKRLSFAHESEMRVVKSNLDYLTSPKDAPQGLSVQIRLNEAIDSIYINPYAPKYYEEVVRSVIRRFLPTLESKVKWSRMRSNPSY